MAENNCEYNSEFNSASGIIAAFMPQESIVLNLSSNSWSSTLSLVKNDSVIYVYVCPSFLIGITGRLDPESSPIVNPWQRIVGILFCLTIKNPLVYLLSSSITELLNVNSIPIG